MAANASSMTLTLRTQATTPAEGEAALIEAAKKDPARFAPLYDAYFEPVYRFVYHRVESDALAADLTQGTFLKALNHLSGYQYKGVPFKAWLFRIAYNEVQMHYRQQGRQRVVSLRTEDVADTLSEMQFEDDNHEENRQRLLKALDGLDEKEMQLVEMRFFEKRPFKEIGDILGITENNAKVRLYRSLDKLRKLI